MTLSELLSKAEYYSLITDEEYKELKKQIQPCEDCISREQAIKQCGFGMTSMLVADCLKKLPSVNPQQGWIPVSERLPKKEGFYLVSIEAMENPPKIITFTGISQYIVHDEYLGEVNDFNRENVIAWMPLPQPYKAESEE